MMINSLLFPRRELLFLNMLLCRIAQSIVHSLIIFLSIVLCQRDHGRKRDLKSPFQVPPPTDLGPTVISGLQGSLSASQYYI